MDRLRIHDPRRSGAQASARAGVLVALALLLQPASLPADAATVAVEACGCLLEPGDRAEVRVRFSNPGSTDADLLVVMQFPNGRNLYLTPVGLVTTPRSWRPVPAGTPLTTASVLDQLLTPESLPFGNYPLLPPFRYQFVSFLSESGTGRQLTPYAAGFFDFAPRDPSPPPSQPGSLHLVPHQHADIAWLDREEVNLADAASYVRDSILEARRRPDYRFIIDQPLVLREFSSRFPELVGELRSLVDQGVAEPAGGYFVQPDLNLLSGESLVRQAIYGQEYLATEWGRRSRIAWNIDSFGHPHQMPQISRKAGMDFYGLSRGIPNLAGRGLEGSEFVWESPDGSRLLAHYMPFGYQIGRIVGDGAYDDQELSEIFWKVQGKASTGSLIAMAGADVSEHVFQLALPEAVEGWSQLQISGVGVRLATASEFFETVASSGVPLPRLSSAEFQDDGEIASPRIFPGAYASRIGIKQTNNRLEHLLLDVEKLATVASLEGADYPEASLREQGERLAINQFHDYLPGTGVDAIYQDPDEELDDLGDRFAAVDAALRQHLGEATAYLTGRIDTTLPREDLIEAIAVFNTMAWERRDLVRIAIDPATWSSPARLLGPDGDEVPYQRIVTETEAAELVFLASVPPLGYATYWLVAGVPAWPPGETVSEHRGSLTAGLGRFTVHLDERGFVRGIFSDATGESVIQAPGAPAFDNLGGVLWWTDERYGNAYDYGPPENTGSQSAEPQSVMLARGPVLTRLVAKGAVAGTSMARREIRLVSALGRIDFETTVYWSDVDKNLYVRFPLSARPGARITEGVPYGFRERGSGHYPVLEWADFGTEAIGVSVINQGLFDHSFSLDPSAITAETTGPQILDITLLRSMNRSVFGEFPSTLMKEGGKHSYRYALLPHHGSWRLARTPRRAWEFGSPLLAVRTPIHSGPLPPERSYLALNPGSHAVATVFQRHAADLVVRLYETDGQAGEHILAFPSLAIDGASETNLLGDPVRSLGPRGPLVLQLAPEEIKTVLLGAPRPAPAAVSSPLDLRRVIDLASAATLRPGSGSTDLSARVVPSFIGADSNDLSGRAASALGDIDGDGLDDILIAAPNGDGPDNAGPDFAGEVYVVFGRPGTEFGSRVPLDQVADLTLYGSSTRAFVGKDVATGDMDGDGFHDIIVGSIANPNGEESRNLSGVTYVVFGRPRAELPARIDLDSEADLAVWGQGGEIAGQRVIAGDLDGDGRADLIIGAPSADGSDSARTGAGEVYVIFGAPRSQISGIRRLEFQYDAVIQGADSLDSLGWGIAAGDLDGDGRDDLAIGAIDAAGKDDASEGSGEVYVFWGGERSELLGSFDMATLDNAVVFYGIDVVDSAGFYLSAGDVDADGRDDLLIGAPLGDGINDSVGDLVGEAYLVFGDERARFPGESSLADVAGLTLYGTAEDDHLGHTVLLSDLNRDGHADLVLAAPVANGPQGTRTDGGTVYGLLGRPRNLLPPHLELSEESANFVIHGATPFSSAGFALAAGDVDGDGSNDLLVGAPFTSNPKTKNGETYLLFGGRFDPQVSELLLLLKAEHDPVTGLLNVSASSSVDPAALRANSEIFLHDGRSTSRVTWNSHEDLNLALSDTLLAWESTGGGDTEIEVFDGAATIRLTDNGFDDVDPRADGSRVVWAGFDGADWEIFLYDGEGVRQLTDNGFDDTSPDVSGTDVVWSGFDGNDFEIFLYDGASSRALTDNGTDDWDPRVSQGQVIWLGDDGQDSEVFLFDGSGVVQLTDDLRDEESPVLDAGRAAWIGSDGSDTEVFAHDPTGVLRLTFNEVPDREVIVSRGRAAWISGEGGHAEVFVFDGRTVSPLTTTPVEVGGLSMEGTSLAWRAPRPGDTDLDGEVFLHDGARLLQLTDDRLEDLDPIVHGGRTAWRKRVVEETLTLDGFGELTYDPDTGLFVGTFRVAETPGSVTVRSSSGASVSTPVPQLPPARRDLAIVQLSDNGGPRPDESPDVSTGQVVWSGYDGHDYEIYLYDGEQIRPITSNETDDVSPRLHGGQVTWEGFDGADREIYLYDGTRVQQITDNDVTDTGPSIHAGLVVWESWIGAAADIYAYRDGAVLRLSETPFSDLSPRVRDGQVVWQGFDGNDFEIYRWDGAAVQALTDNDRDDIEPLTAGGAVVWLGDDGTDLEVFRHAAGVTTRITDDAESAAALAFDGTTIVWQQTDGHDAEIFAYSGGAVTPITDNVHDDVRPSLDAGSIAWQGLTPASREIFLFDAASGAVTQLTADTLEDRAPRLEGGIVVWSANDSGRDYDIFLFDGDTRRNLTSNGAPAPDEFPDIDAGLIAWQSWDGTDTEILIHDGNRTVQATVNPFQDLQPVAGDGIVVWQGLDDFRRRLDDPGGGIGGTGATLVGGDFEIFLWNGREVLRLTANPDFDDGTPRVDSRQIAWLQFDGQDQEVYFFDGTRVTQLTDDAFQQENLRIDSGLVVWQGWDGADLEIYLYDGTSVRALTDNARSDLSPEVHAGQIAWAGFDGNDFEIFLWDGSTTRQLTTNEQSDSFPQIHDGKVVWQHWDGSDSEIFLYDGSAVLQLTDNDLVDARPRIDSGRVVWQTSDGLDLEIFYYDGSETHRLTDNTGDDRNAEISNDRIVWQGFDGLDFEIYLATIPSPGGGTGTSPERGHGRKRQASTTRATTLSSMPFTAGAGHSGPMLVEPPGSTLRFEPGPAQAGPEVRFVAHAPRYNLQLGAAEAALLFGAGPARLLRMRLVGARPEAPGAGLEALPGRSHYLVGRDPSGWRTDVPGFGRVRFAGAYPGIDLEYYGRGDDLEWDFVLAPGADPGRIGITFEGADNLKLDRRGGVAVSVSGETLLLHPPRAYQEIDGHRRVVEARYALAGGRLALRLAAYDGASPLIIDPVLSFATYLGGSDTDAGRAVAVDDSGYVYVTGETLSADVPTAAPLQPSYAGGSNDAFVAKLAPDGATLIYATYLGGSLDDRGFSIAVDALGNAYVTGRTSSADFPTVNAVQPAHGGGANDAFAAKISASGACLLFSTFLGGSGDDRGLGVALDPTGNVALTGITLSSDFPIERPFQIGLRGREDAFVAKLGAAGTPLLFSTYLGGTGTDNGRGIVADALGNVTVVGDTASPDFPTLNALQPAHGGAFDAYVATLEASGSALISSTFLGGSGGDFGLGIGRSLSGAVVVAGITYSGDFPTAAPLQAASRGAADAFVARIDPGAPRLVYSTYLGGSASDFALAVAVDPQGNAYVTGSTSSADFPALHAVQAAPGGGFDAFVTRVNAAGTALDYSTFLGGASSELGFDRTGIAVGALGPAYVVGITHSQDFPARRPLDPTLGGVRDAFVASIDTRPEIVLRIEDAGGQARLVALLANSAATPQSVDLRLWIDSPALGPPFPLGGTPALVTVPPQDLAEALSVLLPSSLPFPGTRVGGRLLDPMRGLVVSESICSTLPCEGRLP